jgi:two-component system response regulator NreC
MTKDIRILLVEDHTVMRQGLERLLSEKPDIKVVGEAGNGREGIEKALELKPDLVLMDIAMPTMNGIEAAKRIKKELPQTKILILSMYSDQHFIQQLIETGISGYLLKDSSGSDINDAIRVVMNGETYLSPSISKKVLDSYFTPKKSCTIEERFDKLSNREREVFQLIAEGYNAKQIADILHISHSTVKTHRTKILEKLGIENIVQIIGYAIHMGLVDPDI